MIQRCVDRFNPTSAHIDTFRYVAEGWRRSTLDEAMDAIYFDVNERGRRREPDLAAAARAVACIELVK